MAKKNIKLFSKILISAVIWLAILLFVGFILTKITSFLLEDALFLSGVLLILIGVFSSIGGDPISASIQGFGQVNAQYIADANLETIKKEKPKNTDIMKTTISIGFSTISLILGGALAVIVAFII